jgi:ADP-heptose:LPS heptosyltransferase
MLPPLFFSVRLPTLLAMFWRRSVRRTSKWNDSHREPASSIVFRLDALGDVVLTTPLFRALKSAHPESRLTVVVQPYIKPLLVTNPDIDEILMLPRIKPQWLPMRLRRLLAAATFYWTQLRGRRFDFAISPRWDVDEHLATFLCALVNANHRVGYSCSTTVAKRRINRGFDAVYDICLPPGPVRHEVLRNLSVAGCLGGTLCDDRLDVHITEHDRSRAARRLANVKPATTLIAIGIGAQSAGRRWPLARFAGTVNRIGETVKVQPLIICSAAELGEALKLGELLRIAPVIVSGAMLREACAVLERCDLLIGNDSGCAHLAAAVGCSTVVISRHPRNGDPNHFNSPIRFAPRGPHVQVLQPAKGRDACGDACTASGPHCILEVCVEDVTAAALLMFETQVARIATPANPQVPPLASRVRHVHSAQAMRRVVETLRRDIDRPSL